ncbi:unnamed protein product [Symbiodinium natans]|uniref:Uncharacterized protein n=1 Tax=Symbiodinium natans TaxID=878477 RepID=A0A812V976_9DINO|nr:unnamed protein product [Symbiodinium natans]
MTLLMLAGWPLSPSVPALDKPVGRTLAPRKLSGLGVTAAFATAARSYLRDRGRGRFRGRRHASSSFEGFPTSLDFGLYFFGRGGVCQKYVDGRDNAHFSPNNDTLVYVHGWEVGRVSQIYRETFNWKNNEPRCGLDLDLAGPWLDRGWNVAIFYWDMFSDEPWLPDAEAKIWTASGSRRMRYRLASGDFQERGSPSQSASVLLGKCLTGLVRAAPGKRLRLAGHSLGSPLVIAAASNMFSRCAPNPATIRLVLLDPYWSRRVRVLNPQDYLESVDTLSQMPRSSGRNATTADLSLSLALMLARKRVLFEIYYSCPAMTQMPIVADSKPAEELARREFAALVNYDASCCDPWDFQAQHLLAPNLYLHSMRYPAPGCGAPSASASDEALANALGKRWHRPGLARQSGRGK